MNDIQFITIKNLAIFLYVFALWARSLITRNVFTEFFSCTKIDYHDRILTDESLLCLSFFSLRHSERVYILDKGLREAVQRVANNPTQESLDLVYSLIEALGERYTELKILVAWCSVTYGIAT